ncbi:MAG: hypothetical protein Greene041679_112 [Parcubacteria group bacterium Greene0416_79]|nr:MAG: hypothetical protein Greene041679_112 [Parcubacteria group bacterium Greene0416_79]
MNCKNEYTPRAIRELLDETRRKQFVGGGICELFIAGERNGGGEIADISIKDGKVCIILRPFLQLVGGRWSALSEYSLVVEVTEAWCDGGNLLIAEKNSQTMIALRPSLRCMLERRRPQQSQKEAA